MTAPVRRDVLLGLAAALCVPLTPPVRAEARADVVAIGGSVTEIVYALGQGHRLAARDSTSTHPPQVRDLPDVGYMRALSAEGVLSVAPALILAEEGAGPPETVALLQAARVPFVTVPDGYSGAAIAAKVRALGAALEVPEQAETLAAEITARLDAAAVRADSAAQAKGRKRVLFVLSQQGGRVMAAGHGTAAEAIIELAGGTNALSGFEGYKQVSDEALAAAAPDAILMMARGGTHGPEVGGILDSPALRGSPAAQADRLVRMDGLLLLGFGPRTDQAVSALSAALYDTE